MYVAARGTHPALLKALRIIYFIGCAPGHSGCRSVTRAELRHADAGSWRALHLAL